MAKEKEPESKAKRCYDSEGTKKRLLKAATNVFAKFGFDAATTREIADAAGVNESLIHRYFSNKEGLFHAILDESHREKFAALPYPARETLGDEITSFLRFRLESHRAKKKITRLLILRAITDPKVRTQMGEVSRKGSPALLERFAKLQAQGLLDGSVNIDHLCVLIGGIVFSMVMFSEVISTMDAEKGDAVVELAAKLLTKALSP